MSKKLDPVVMDYLLRTPWRRVLRDQALLALIDASGNKSAAARKLKIARRAFYMRLAS